jgi:diguanylate cyclase (GGDEF)-like protein/PAS domain S-box-containing protein
LLSLFVLLSLCLCAHAEQRAPHKLTAELRSIRDVRHFKPTSQDQLVPVHVQAVVTYYDSVAPNLFVQDATNGIWVDLRQSKVPPPKIGELLDLRGTLGTGFSPYLANPEWKVIGKSAPPNPLRLLYEQAATGSFDSQWVELEGVVRSFVQQADGNVLVMDVATPTGTFKVRVPDYHAGFPLQLVDARVRFHGVCGAAFNRRNQLVAIHLLMPSINNLNVLEPAPTDPFAVEATSIARIRQFSADLTDVRRLKVLGIVTARFPGQGLFLMDSSGGLYAESQDGSPVQAGDEVEVIGFPAAGNYSPILKSAGIRPTGKHYNKQALEVSGTTALSGGVDAELVRIDGTLRSYRQHLRSQALVVETDDHITFEARFPLPVQLTPIAIGSKVRLTGICSVRAEENGNPAEFELTLRTPEDIAVLTSPPWLSARRAASILSLLALVTAAVVGWLVVLRRRVRQQTTIIKTNLENEAALEERYRRIFERNLTGLYVARSDGSILDCNDACARIFGFSNREELLKHRTEAELIARQFDGNARAEAAKAENSIVNAELQFRRVDGTWGWVLSSARFVEYKNGADTLIEGALVDITDRKQAEQRVQFLAYYDSLTALPNRTLLQDRLAKALASARRHKDKVGVLFIDLDRFKTINDSLGHSYGDLLLQELSQRLLALSREQDTVARLGGDEFLVVLSGIKDASDGALVAARISQAVNEPFTIHGQVLSVTCSIGISIFPEHGEDAETMIKNADAAMYSSKDHGRDTFRFFTQEMTSQALERLTLENSLRTALDRHELFLMFQPAVDVATGAITCWEALLRWRHPELGLVPPDKFIRIAENNGLIVPIGEWVLRTACAQAKAWNEQGLLTVPVAVNVSAVQFRQEAFCEMVKRILNETALDPRLLELELTESLLLSNQDVVFKVLGELKSMGVSLAIDDFGTGYSSLSYLKQFPVSKLKIDRSFICDLAANNDDEAITAAIINMAKCLNLAVTAEGVETEEQLSLLRARGCDEVQGYLFSKPLPIDDVAAKLRENPIFAQAIEPFAFSGEGL